MSQKKNWEKEYANQKLMTLGDEPQADVLRFLKWARRKKNIDIANSHVLDLGCGTGRNSNYLAAQGAKVTALEFAANALNIARARAHEHGLAVDYQERSIGESWPVGDGEVDVILDITSSNSLNEAERLVYLSELERVLKPNGLIFVRALCKDGDKNAKYLIKEFAGPETDTYVLPELGIVERVFTEVDFRKLYVENLEILNLEKKTGYQRFNNQSYKRNYWLAYLGKK